MWSTIFQTTLVFIIVTRNLLHYFRSQSFVRCIDVPSWLRRRHCRINCPFKSLLRAITVLAKWRKALISKEYACRKKNVITRPSNSQRGCHRPTLRDLEICGGIYFARHQPGVERENCYPLIIQSRNAITFGKVPLKKIRYTARSWKSDINPEIVVIKTNFTVKNVPTRSSNKIG